MACVLRHVFGLDATVKNGIQVVDESTVLYVAAHCIVLHSTATRTQRFLQLGGDSRGAVCLATTPNRRWLAVSERGASKGYVTVYDMAILKKRKVLIPSQDNAAAKVRGLSCAPFTSAYIDTHVTSQTPAQTRKSANN